MNRLTIAAIAAAFISGASGAWWVQSTRHAEVIAQIKADQLAQEIASRDTAINDMTGALRDWREQLKENNDDFQKLDSSLAALRSTVGGMRGELSNLPGFITNASRESLGDYATTCTNIFESMARMGAEMGHAGAAIARAADQHAADAQLVTPR